MGDAEDRVPLVVGPVGPRLLAGAAVGGVAGRRDEQVLLLESLLQGGVETELRLVVGADEDVPVQAVDDVVVQPVGVVEGVVVDQNEPAPRGEDPPDLGGQLLLVQVLVEAGADDEVAALVGEGERARLVALEAVARLLREASVEPAENEDLLLGEAVLLSQLDGDVAVGGPDADDALRRLEVSQALLDDEHRVEIAAQNAERQGERTGMLGDVGRGGIVEVPEQGVVRVVPAGEEVRGDRPVELAAVAAVGGAEVVVEPYRRGVGGGHRAAPPVVLLAPEHRRVDLAEKQVQVLTTGLPQQVDGASDLAAPVLVIGIEVVELEVRGDARVALEQGDQRHLPRVVEGGPTRESRTWRRRTIRREPGPRRRRRQRGSASEGPPRSPWGRRERQGGQRC